jgi:hypothetical protein
MKRATLRHFALDYHRTLADLALSARAGLHVGPVSLRENTPEDIARGAKPIEIAGLALPFAARSHGACTRRADADQRRRA